MAGGSLRPKAAIRKQFGATSPTGRRHDDDSSGRRARALTITRSSTFLFSTLNMLLVAQSARSVQREPWRGSLCAVACPTDTLRTFGDSSKQTAPHSGSRAAPPDPRLFDQPGDLSGGPCGPSTVAGNGGMRSDRCPAIHGKRDARFVAKRATDRRSGICGPALHPARPNTPRLVSPPLTQKAADHLAPTAPLPRCSLSWPQ